MTLAPSPEHGGGQPAAEIGVEAGPVTGAVGNGKAGHAGADAAPYAVARHDGIEDLASVCRAGQHDHREHDKQIDIAGHVVVHLQSLSIDSGCFAWEAEILPRAPRTLCSAVGSIRVCDRNGTILDIKGSSRLVPINDYM